MTKDAVIDVIHKTIYGFFSIVEDDSEEPISEKDKLLLEVNKAVCNAVKEMPDEERKTGRWLKDGENDFLCSVCNNGYKDQPTCMGKPMFMFCPCCGAFMKGGAE